ncbi:hypothetical protein GCM10007919_15490 [Rhizobium indigoferae]|nr:hypothetical protein GCM10007919_15490 [Rhizobium indigoferae]
MTATRTGRHGSCYLIAAVVSPQDGTGSWHVEERRFDQQALTMASFGPRWTYAEVLAKLSPRAGFARVAVSSPMDRIGSA